MFSILLPLLKGLLLSWIILCSHVVCAQVNSLDKRNTTISGHWTWDVSDWSKCKYHKPGDQSSCLRRRTVTCVFTKNWPVVAPFYCHRYASDLKPETEESCSPCHRPCILSQWKPWSECNCGKKYRTRSVLYMPPEGAVEQCQPTVEQAVCEDNNATCDRVYEWRHGEWSSCRMVSHAFLYLVYFETSSLP